MNATVPIPNAARNTHKACRMCEVIHVKDRKPGDVYIGRAGHSGDGYFGNPHPVGRYCHICGLVHDRPGSIMAFKKYFRERLHRDPEFYERVLELKDKRLVCFCKPQACHGDVYRDWFDADCPM